MINRVKRRGTTRLFWVSLAAFYLGLLFYAGTSFMAIYGISNDSIRQRSEFEQSLFVDSITKDIQMGPHSEIQRKCNHLYRSGHVEAIRIEDRKGRVICSLPDAGVFPVNARTIESHLFFDESNPENLLLKVQTNYAQAPSNEFFSSSLPFLLVAIFSVGLFVTFCFKKYFADPTAQLAKTLLISNLEEMSEQLKSQSSSRTAYEVDVIHQAVEHMADKLLKAEAEKLEHAKLEGMVQIASQVVHDIRSPISALSLAVKNVAELSEHQRTIIRTATQQIKDIANNLLVRKSTLDGEESGVAQEEAQPELLFAVIDNTLSTKRAQYSESLEKEALNIEFITEEDAYGLFVKICPVELNRLLSNLISNGVEAMEQKGLLQIRLNFISKALKAQIQIQDSGCGMSAEVLEKVMKGGVSYKKGGHGMGLASSKSKVEQAGGVFHIESCPGQGTTITLEFEAAEVPEWFRSRVPLPEGGTLVVLDDDPTIHHIWDVRCGEFFGAQGSSAAIPLIHFDNPKSFEGYDFASLGPAVHYLVDYELRGSRKTGLDAIEKLGIASQATLVTSRYEDPMVRARCLKLGCKILPKNYAPHAPLFVMPAKPDLVFVDDNDLMIQTWELAASYSHHRILTFNSSSDARDVILSLPQDTPIYVDSSLSNDEKGEDFAKELYQAGFRELFLATGHPASSFGELPWIKKIVGKDFPEDLPRPDENQRSA